MKELWLTLRTEPTAHIALVLDASKSAQQYWQDISTLARDLIEALPATAQMKVFFLGNPHAYPAANFSRQSNQWHQENLGRVRLMGRVFEQLENEAETSVVVLAAGRVFDAEDWVKTSIGKRTIFVRFGNVALTDKRYPEWEPSLEQLRLRLNNPVKQVEILVRGAMPFFWDNDAYQWDGAQLVANEAKQFAVCVGFLLAPTSHQRQTKSLCYEAVATLANGEKRTMPLKPCEPCFPVYNWQDLTPQEAKTFRQCVREQGRYYCPVCGNLHDASKLRCDKDDESAVLGTLIYPTLTNWHGIVLLREVGGQVKFCLYPCAALRIHDDIVAVRAHGQAEMYRFDAASGSWCKSGKRMAQYQKVEPLSCATSSGDTYAIIL